MWKRVGRDRQREKVYRAERKFRDEIGCNYMLRDDEVKKLIRRLVGRSGLKVEVKFKNGDRFWARARRVMGERYRVELPRWARNEVVICHELAHILAGLENWHNGAFVSQMIKLYRRVAGREKAEMLKKHFRAERVRVTGRGEKPIWVFKAGE